MSAHRWMKFWPGDWKGDAALRMCGLAARGLWIECIAIMHEAEPYGHLMVNGRALTTKQLASIVGAPERDVVKLLAELEEAGVFSRTDSGTIFSRRMVRDAAKSEEGREAIAKRWANKASAPAPIDDPNTPPNRSGNSPPGSLEERREKKEEPPSQPSVGRSPRGSRLPPDWSPSEADRAFADGLMLNVERTAANFRDFWHAKAGKDAAKLDWSATWRNWCRREAERLPTAKNALPRRESNLAWMHGLLTPPADVRPPPSFDLDLEAEPAP